MSRGGRRVWNACPGSSQRPRRILVEGPPTSGICSVCGVTVTVYGGKIVRHKRKEASGTA